MGGIVFLIIVGIVIYNIIMKADKNLSSTTNKSNNSSTNKTYTKNYDYKSKPITYAKQGLEVLNENINTIKNSYENFDIEEEVEKRLQKQIEEIEEVYERKYETLLKEANASIEINSENFEEVLSQLENQIDLNECSTTSKQKLKNIYYRIQDKLNINLGNTQDNLLFENFDELYQFMKEQSVYNAEQILKDGIDIIESSGSYRYSKEGVLYIELASALGSKAADYYLGNLYYKANKDNRDMEKAFYYLKKAAEKGHADAKNSLGIILATGDGYIQNLEEAKKYFLEAMKKGSVEAKENLKILEEHLGS
jgi:hypothetical protein